MFVSGENAQYYSTFFEIFDYIMTPACCHNSSVGLFFGHLKLHWKIHCCPPSLPCPHLQSSVDFILELNIISFIADLMSHTSFALPIPTVTLTSLSLSPCPRNALLKESATSTRPPPTTNGALG